MTLPREIALSAEIKDLWDYTNIIICVYVSQKPSLMA